MNKNRTKKIATWIIVPLMAAIFILDIATVVIGNSYSKRYMPSAETFGGENGDDRIHFLNTANSDAILLESNGRFALIDAGEGNNNPRRKTEYKGYEKEVTDYIKKTASGDDGIAYLDFVLGTHYHYDHVGSFHAVITDPLISIGKAYFKKYDPSIDKKYESGRWKLGEIYDEIMTDLSQKGIEVISDIPDAPFEFGDFTLRFLNTDTPSDTAGKGENAGSIGVLVTKGSKKAFLAADITKSTGLESIVSPEIGDIDLLKAGHHGYYGSSSAGFLRGIKPEMIIVTNQQGKVYPNVKWNFTMVAKAPFYGTYDYNGIIANFTDDGNIILTNNIH